MIHSLIPLITINPLSNPFHILLFRLLNLNLNLNLNPKRQKKPPSAFNTAT